MFRDDFVWGVASSAYQVEGRDPEDGCGKNIWDIFAEEGRILDGKDAYTACDHMHRYKEDYKLMKLLGIKAYRFSMSWARILPEGTGKVNEKAIAMYRDMIREPDALQFFDEYKADSTLIFRIFQHDSLQNEVVFRFEIRNDSLFVRNDSVNTSIRILELTDSTMFIDYTRTKNDTTFYLQSRCRRSPLPESLRPEQTPTAEITE